MDEIIMLRKPRAYKHKRYGTSIDVIGYDERKRVYFNYFHYGEVIQGMLPARMFNQKYERVE